MGIQALISEEIVTQVFEVLGKPEGSARQLRRMSQEEPALAAMVEEQLKVLVSMLEAWGAHESAREVVETACRVHVAGLYAAWRMGLLKRWERESGVVTE